MRGTRRIATTVVVCGMLVGTVFAGSAPAATEGTTRLTAHLSGESEVPGPGDDNGAGWAVIKVMPAKQRVCFTLSWSRIGAPFAAHIHRGKPGVAGPVRVTLFASAEQLPSTIHDVGGCVEGVNEDVARRIASHPGWFYVNVHNPRFPDGAIRGQLTASAA